MRLRPGTPPPLRLEPLADTHPIAGFSCGDSAIDAFLHTQALPEQQVGLSSTTVAVELSSGKVIGFFSISPLTIKIDPRVLVALGIGADAIPYAQVGGYLLGRLGTDQSCQGQGVATGLVAVAAAHARRSREKTGGVYLAVDAKTDRLVEWYQTLGFRRVGTLRRLVLKL